MNTLRLFIALELNNEVWSKLEGIIQYMKTQGFPSVRWVGVKNTHLTLKFLGEVPEENIPALRLLLTKTATQYNPFYLIVSGLGIFPNSRQPRILWVGINAPDELNNLQKAIEMETRSHGYPVESRPFRAHLTLGRVTEDIMPPEISKMIQVMGSIDASNLGTVLVQSIQLYKSDLKPTGAEYTALASAPLLGQKNG